jgi:hypothetical protein
MGLVGAAPLVPIVGRQWASSDPHETIGAEQAREIGIVLTSNRMTSCCPGARAARRLARCLAVR